MANEVEWRKNELLALCSATDIALNEIIKKHLDSLISAAELQGMKKQQEQDAQYDKYEREGYEQAEKNRIAAAHAEGVAEGRKEGITKGIARNAYEMGKHEGVAEGAEKERERIRTVIWKRYDEELASDIAFVLAPTKEVAG